MLERRASELECVGVRIGRDADVLPVEDVLPQPAVPAGRRGIEGGIAKAVGGGVRVGVERRLAVARVAGPPTHRDLLEVPRVAHDEVV